MNNLNITNNEKYLLKALIKDKLNEYNKIFNKSDDEHKKIIKYNCEQLNDLYLKIINSIKI